MITKELMVRDKRMAFWDEGSGDVLLLVHGFPLSRKMWEAVIPALSASCRVLAPDLLGFGQSSNDGAFDTMGQAADDLAAFLQALMIEKPVTLIGLSMGGYIAFEFWKRSPDKLARLLLCDTKATADAPQAIAQRHAMAQVALEQGSKVATEPMVSRLLGAASQTQADIVEALQTMMFSTPPSTIAAAQHAMAKRHSFEEVLGQIRIPCLVLCGAEDMLSPPAEMQRMASQLPDAHFHVIENAGHMVPMEQPLVFVERVQEFLNATST
ncbi:MAG: alpha/beta hydrolase [Pirellulales bacterium]